MRGLLWVFVLATVIVAWFAGVRAVSSRAAARHAGEAAMELPQAPGGARAAEGLPPGGGEGDPPSRTERAVATIEVAAAATPPVDPVPVDVILVDGENGAVLRCTTTKVERGPEAVLAFRVLAPDGYVAEVESRDIRAHISRRAERARVVEPLCREADIRVHVVDRGGRPVGGARVVEVLRGGAPPDIQGIPPGPAAEFDLLDGRPKGTIVPSAWSAPSGADGWLRVRGVPHLLDECYWIVVRRGAVEAFIGVVLGAFGEKHEIEVVLPAASSRPEVTIGLGGGAGGGKRGRGGRRQLAATATLEVIVRRKDGLAGAGFEVAVGSVKRVTDGSGRALFENLPAGTWAVQACDPGFAWSQAQVELEPGERRTFVLSEAPGWAASARLEDSMGRPVPFARVEVASQAPVAHVRVEEGVQDLVLLTDADGTVRVPDMHHAPVTLTFRYGSRFERATLTESEPFATVRLPPP